MRHELFCSGFLGRAQVAGHGVLGVSPGVGRGTGHLKGPKNPDEPNLGMHVLVCVYKIHMCT